MNFPALGGRRFVLTALVFLTCAVLLWFGKLSDSSFCTITLAAVVGLITGHTYENVKSAGTQESNP